MGEEEDPGRSGGMDPECFSLGGRRCRCRLLVLESGVSSSVLCLPISEGFWLFACVAAGRKSDI